MTLITFDWSRMRPAFYRRYKWAFQPEYDRILTPAVAQPELYKLLTVCNDVLQVCCFASRWLLLIWSKDETFSPAASVEMAENILSGLIQSRNVGGWAGSWAPDRLQVCLPFTHAIVWPIDAVTSFYDVFLTLAKGSEIYLDLWRSLVFLMWCHWSGTQVWISGSHPLRFRWAQNIFTERVLGRNLSHLCNHNLV